MRRILTARRVYTYGCYCIYLKGFSHDCHIFFFFRPEIRKKKKPSIIGVYVHLPHDENIILYIGPTNKIEKKKKHLVHGFWYLPVQEITPNDGDNKTIQARTKTYLYGKSECFRKSGFSDGSHNTHPTRV